LQGAKADPRLNRHGHIAGLVFEDTVKPRDIQKLGALRQGATNVLASARAIWYEHLTMLVCFADTRCKLINGMWGKR
jgi:hypothetical protein